MSGNNRVGVRRNAEDTRQRILKAAEVAFADKGYDQAGVREIAAAAGVNAALVNRYFGSKEALFETVITEGFSIRPLLSGDRKRFAVLLAEYVLSKSTEDSFDATHALVRSAGSQPAAELMGRAMEHQFVAPLAQWLGGPDAKLRAAMIAALLAGTAVMRDVLEVRPLRTRHQAVAETLADLLVVLIEGKRAQSGSSRPRRERGSQ
jgi:AcrR family transcriptional regulator